MTNSLELSSQNHEKGAISTDQVIIKDINDVNHLPEAVHIPTPARGENNVSPNAIGAPSSSVSFASSSSSFCGLSRTGSVGGGSTTATASNFADSRSRAFSAPGQSNQTPSSKNNIINGINGINASNSPRNSPRSPRTVVQHPEPDDSAKTNAAKLSRHEQLAIEITLAVNFILALTKIVAFLTSWSMAVLASLVDSLVDLGAQSVLWYANRAKDKRSTLYPAGRARIEPVGVMVAASVMGMASVEVIRESSKQLADGQATVVMGTVANAMVGAVIFIKIFLWRGADWVAKKTGSSSVDAIAMDNFNDIISNTGAMIFANLGSSRDLFSGSSFLHKTCWTFDPIGAILISLYIMWSWFRLGVEQAQILVGKVADTEFLEEVRKVAEAQPNMKLDKLTAYHFGPKFLVELEVVMREDTILKDSHDAGIKLQHLVESLDQVERCFVHIDYATRESIDDHDPAVPLYLKTYSAVTGSPVGGSDMEIQGLLENEMVAL